MNLGHGGNVQEICRKYNIDEDHIVDFSANINPLGLSSKLRLRMIDALDRIERYPDITYYDLKSSLSKYEGIDISNILLGNGAAEVIFNIVRGMKPKNVLLPAPTFSEYEDAVKSIGGEIKYYILNKENFILDDEFIENIDESIDMTFICNPNNPTGRLTSKEYIIKVLEKSKKTNTIVVMDESFLDFVYNKEKYSAINLCKEHSNLIIVKSLTKFFAFPGIRIGYGITNNSNFINIINSISIPWSINTVAAEGAIVALDEEEYKRETVKYVNEEKLFLYEELNRFEELNVYEGAVNFIFFKINSNLNLREELIKEGILIRSCSNYIGLDERYYRVAVRTRRENIKLLNALKKVL